MKATTEAILNSQSIDEFNTLVRCFKCELCPLREEAWVRGDHEFPIPNDVVDATDRTDLLIVGGSLGVGEGPLGIPFSNAAGLLLRGAIDSISAELKQEVSYATLNICMCFPEDGRSLHVSEAQACSPFLFKQISLMHPNAILALGSAATRYLLHLPSNPIMKNYIGNVYETHLPNRIDTIPTVAAYHPSYLIRQMGNGSVSKELEAHYFDVISKSIQLARRYKSD